MPRQLPPPPPTQNRRLDPKIWRACAGAAVQIPTLNSRVYYFPQGHMDQASTYPQNLSPRLLSRPMILCRVAAVQFLADHLTDEVFAKLILHPVTESLLAPPQRFLPASGDDGGEKVVSFAKVLTPSDANNGGGFSVPRFCADSIFPALDYQADPPVQNLTITDVHGAAWEFRHIYRGTPRRHLLTTGWSKFVNSKKLIAGDSVVFMKNSRGEMFVGLRRASRFSGGGDGARRGFSIGMVRSRMEDEEPPQEERSKEGFSRNGKGKLSPKSVAEAAEFAAQDKPFEVVYYPKSGWSDFVVKAEAVEEAISVRWSPGMRVKMAVETDDSSRMTWFQGMVSSICLSDNGHWPRSPWRMLQITWDEPEVLQNSKWVSPWQVELASASPGLHTVFPPTKRFKAAQDSAMFTDGEGDPFSMTRFTNSTMGHLNQTLLNCGIFPAGMQGARHDMFSSSNFSNFPSGNSRLYMGNSFGSNTVPRLNTLSTELNVGSSQSGDLSPDSHSSLHSLGTDSVRNQNINSAKPGSFSFQLFGAIIHTKPPDESGSPQGCNDTEGIDNPLDDSLTYSKLLDRLDAQCQIASTVEACYL